MGGINGNVPFHELLKPAIRRASDWGKPGPKHSVMDDKQVCPGGSCALNGTAGEVYRRGNTANLRSIFELEAVNRHRIIRCRSRLQERVEIVRDFVNTRHVQGTDLCGEPRHNCDTKSANSLWLRELTATCISLLISRVPPSTPEAARDRRRSKNG